MGDSSLQVECDPLPGLPSESGLSTIAIKSRRFLCSFKTQLKGFDIDIDKGLFG